jgi:hypothetical protein
MPNPPGARSCIIVPSTLEIGWAKSPAYLCVATDTGWDIIHLLLHEKIKLPEHPFKNFMKPTDTPKTSPANEDHTAISKYVDNYILAVVENKDRKCSSNKYQEQCSLRSI